MKALIALAFFLAACTPPAVLQTSTDGGVQVTDAMLRNAFDEFCGSSEAEGNCAKYSEYTYDEVFTTGDDGVGVWFLYGPALEDYHRETDKVISIGCLWRPGHVECHSGAHEY